MYSHGDGVLLALEEYLLDLIRGERLKRHVKSWKSFKEALSGRVGEEWTLFIESKVGRVVSLGEKDLV